jgi:hypothetical protein
MEVGYDYRSAFWVDIFHLTVLYKWIADQFPIVHVLWYGTAACKSPYEKKSIGGMVSGYKGSFRSS